MEDFLLYIAKSGICLGFFLITYVLFLRPATFYKFNRAFLISGLILSFIIPSVRYTYDVIVPEIITVEQTLANTETVATSSPVDIQAIIFIVYIIGFFILVIRNMIVYSKLWSYIKNGMETRIDNIRVIENKDIKSPFSVLNYILFNPQSLNDTEKKLILKHESIHINQKHRLDLLCGECILLIQWFNPLAWIYVHLLKENHEFLADQAVIDSGVSPAVYQAVLVNQRFQGQIFAFSNPFKYKNQFKRLTMMKKEKSSPWKKVLVLALVPMLGVFIWASATPRYIYVTQNLDRIKQAVDSGIVTKHVGIITIDQSGNKSASQPVDVLCFVDGKEIKGKIDQIKPGDIESISVLKDTTATKIYGEKGKNGVILITTKDNKQEAGITALQQKDVLCFVDGKEYKGKIDQIKPGDIESISVLKDATATKIYGEKGKNGVILITTKDKK